MLVRMQNGYLKCILMVFVMNKNKLSNHIIFVLPSLRGGGAERVFVQLANKFANNDFEVSLILLEETGPLAEILDNKVSVKSINVSKARYAYWKLLEILKSLQPDVIYTTHDRVNILVALMKPFLPNKTKLFIRQTNVLSVYLEQHSFMKRLIKKVVYGLTYNLANGIITQCGEMKEDLTAVLHRLKRPIYYIYNPLNIEYIKCQMTKFNPYENKDQKVVVSAGRLVEQKDFKTLILAFSEVVKVYHNTILYILGDGSLKGDLEKLINSLNLKNSIILTGYVQNPYPYYHYAKLFVLSSKYEGFPNVLLEALATGVNIISTGCRTGVKEIMDNAGLIDNTVAVGDVIALKDKILEKLVNEETAITNTEIYDINNVFEKYVDITVYS